MPWCSYACTTLYFRKATGSQIHLRELERSRITEAEKHRIIKSLKSANHKYVAFFVCRNPLEKLQSLYNFFLYQTKVKQKTFKKFPRFNPPSWSEYISHVSNPSYSDSMSDSLFSKCSPCTFHYDAIIRMEKFNADSRYVLTITMIM